MTVTTEPFPRTSNEKPARHRNAGLRVLVALPGLHAVTRGAEIAFESVSDHLARQSDWEVTLAGSGPPRPERRYDYLQVNCVSRSRFEGYPRVPMLRSEYAYEELTFAWGLWRAYDPDKYDVTVACSYPYTNWLLRARRSRRHRPAHIFVTQNGDWPASSNQCEFRLFSCDGLVCTNPEYYDRNKGSWRCVLIPNGVDTEMFSPGPANRSRFGLPEHVPVALMVSALIPSKRVVEGIRCAAQVPDLHLVVAGDGPLRRVVDEAGDSLMGSRFCRFTVERAQMPDLYRVANVFLHMSLVEPSANAYLEAVATGLPVITHDRRVTRWTFEGTAVLVDATDDDAVVGALRHAIEGSSAGEIQERRDLVEQRFTWAAIARQYAAFLSKVVSRAV